MQSEMGSTRALACSDRRPAARNEGLMQSLNGDSFERSIVVGEVANHSTRGCVRSPSRLRVTAQASRSMQASPKARDGTAKSESPLT